MDYRWEEKYVAGIVAVKKSGGPGSRLNKYSAATPLHKHNILPSVNLIPLGRVPKTDMS